jgi:CxxC motif-containing protein
MERKLVCISCPLGCRLTVTWEDETEIKVAGNKCANGESYAKEEILAPKRVVTATVAVTGPASDGWTSTGRSGAARTGAAQTGAGESSASSPRRLPVKTSAPLLKEHIPDLLNKLYRMEVKPPLDCGEVLLKDIAGTGVDLVVTRSLKAE